MIISVVSREKVELYPRDHDYKVIRGQGAGGSSLPFFIESGRIPPSVLALASIIELAFLS